MGLICEKDGCKDLPADWIVVAFAREWSEAQHSNCTESVVVITTDLKQVKLSQIMTSFNLLLDQKPH